MPGTRPGVSIRSARPTEWWGGLRLPSRDPACTQKSRDEDQAAHWVASRISSTNLSLLSLIRMGLWPRRVEVTWGSGSRSHRLVEPVSLLGASCVAGRGAWRCLGVGVCDETDRREGVHGRYSEQRPLWLGAPRSGVMHSTDLIETCRHRRRRLGSARADIAIAELR